MRSPYVRIGVAAVAALLLIGGAVVAVRTVARLGRTHIVGYFDNSNGLFAHDEVRILGVPVGAIESIEPQAERVKITFWVDGKYKVPADAKAAIVSPQLVTSRAIQLTPAYTGGAVMANGAVIPESRTAVPLEWDDLRQQLGKLTAALQPTEPGGVSTLGAFVDTAANNLRGQGVNIHGTIVKMAQAFSALGDHSADTFSTIRNLSLVVSALQDSSTLLAQLNRNLASVTGSLDADPGAVGAAINDLNTVVGQATQFIADNKETLGVTTDKLASISSAVHDNLDDIKQALHVLPNAAQNFANVYQPSQAALTGILAVNNLADPISFLCGAVQAASRLGAEQSAKLCVQYLAPIIKNRQYNFMPLGENLFVGESARPNELTYTEDWMRPDHVPPPPAPAAPEPAPPKGEPPPAPGPVATNPAAGLSGMMVPGGGGS
ncbi:MCE family protein [Mycobacterium avium]|uniref:MCE family protein n=1 Tax=Mycobacterium avium TaxID=1764 RepID=UPI0007A0916F|nr:MCE family protein [Mycobacterium avium]